MNEPQKNPLATASVILSSLSVVLGPFGCVPGIICGHLAKARIRRGQTSEGGNTATVGLVMGYVLLSVMALLTVELARLAASGALASPPASARQYFDPRLVAGASPFPLTGVDLEGKTVSLDQFEGKVLLIDFWAVWCGPCVGEMPNVVAAYNKYHADGFEIIGVSLDPLSDRTKLETFVGDHKMPWRQIFDGKFWSAENAVAYGVHSIPFTVLVGRDGKIAAVSARGPDLAPAVEAALKAQ